MKNTYLYIRVADPDPERWGERSQRCQLLRYAVEHGLAICRECIDHGSAADPTAPPPPGLQQVLADARDGKYDTLLVTSFDRLHRNRVVAVAYIRELYRCGVAVYSVRDGITGDAVLKRHDSLVQTIRVKMVKDRRSAATRRN